MDTIYPLLLPYGKFILATGLLIGFYRLLYKKNAAYNHSRFYLLALPFLALLLSGPVIEVYTPPVRTIEVEVADISHNLRHTTDQKFRPGIPTGTGEATKERESRPSIIQEEALSPSSVETSLSKINWLKTLFILYSFISALLLLHPLIGIIQILLLKKKGKKLTYRGLTVVKSAKVHTPFSFCTTIYLSDKLRDSQSQMILAHERWHILHKHYRDVMLIEFITRLLWFNPLLWWVRHELRNIHEYQADRSVLDHGQDLYEYQTTLLEEVMNHSCCVANGFNHSFIKQRFIAMKNEPNIRFLTLRNLLIVPFLLLLFVLFTFTKGEAKIVYLPKPEIRRNQPVEPPPSKILADAHPVTEKEEPGEALNTVTNPSLPPIHEEPPIFPEPSASNTPVRRADPQIAAMNLKEANPELNATKVESLTKEDHLNLSRMEERPGYPQFNKVTLSSFPFTNDIAECPIYIEKNENETLITRIYPIRSDWARMSFSDKNKIMLIDSKTGDRYILREIKGGYPTGQPFYIRRHEGQMIEFVFAFPPLPSSVKTIDIIDGTNVYGFKIKEHVRKKIKVIR